MIKFDGDVASCDYDYYLEHFLDEDFQSSLVGWHHDGYTKNTKGMIIGAKFRYKPLTPPQLDESHKFYCDYHDWLTYFSRNLFKKEWGYMGINKNHQFVFIRMNCCILNPYSDYPHLLQEIYYREDKWAISNVDWLLDGCPDSVKVLRDLF